MLSLNKAVLKSVFFFALLSSSSVVDAVGGGGDFVKRCLDGTSVKHPRTCANQVEHRLSCQEGIGEQLSPASDSDPATQIKFFAASISVNEINGMQFGTGQIVIQKNGNDFQMFGSYRLIGHGQFEFHGKSIEPGERINLKFHHDRMELQGVIFGTEVKSPLTGCIVGKY